MKKIWALFVMTIAMAPLIGCKTVSPEHQVLERAYDKMIQSDNYEYTIEVAFDGKTITHYYSIDADLMFYRFERAIHEEYMGPYHHGEIRSQYIRFEEDKETLYTNYYNDYVIRYDYVVTEVSAEDNQTYDEIRDLVLFEWIKSYDSIASIEDQSDAWIYTFVFADFPIETLRSVCDVFPLRNGFAVDEMTLVFQVDKTKERVSQITSSFLLHTDSGDLTIDLTITLQRFGLVELTLPTNLVD